MEIFAIYDKTTGEISSLGKVDRAGIQDGHSMLENITRALANDDSLAVIYRPNRPLPDKNKYRIINGKVVRQNADYVPKIRRIEMLIARTIRAKAIQWLIASGADIPENYK